MRLQVAVTEKNERLGPTSTPVMKFSVSQRYGVIPSDELENRTMQAKSLEKYKVVAEDDLVLNSFNAYKGALGLAPGTGVVSPDYFVAVVNPTLADARFIRYFLLAQPSAEIIRRDMGGMGSGDPDSSAFARFDVRSLLSMEVAIDDLGAQRAIADYLDRETAEIDAMTADLDKMEALLTERRGSIVRTHLLPEGKEYTRVKLKAAVSLGKTVQSKQKNAEEVQRNYVRAAHIQPHGRLALDEQPMWFTTSELEQLSLRANDVLVVEGGAGYGRSVVLKEDLPEWGFQNHVIRVRPNPGVVGEFIHYTFLAHYNAGLIDLLADGATIPALSSDKARELPILSVDEHYQRKIVGMVERETAEIDAMLVDITELRDLLAERRAALIAAAVTGQINIPAAKEPTHA